MIQEPLNHLVSEELRRHEYPLALVSCGSFWLHGVKFIFDTRDAVKYGERLPHVLIEQSLKVQDGQIKRF